MGRLGFLLLKALKVGTHSRLGDKSLETRVEMIFMYSALLKKGLIPKRPLYFRADLLVASAQPSQTSSALDNSIVNAYRCLCSTALSYFPGNLGLSSLVGLFLAGGPVVGAASFSHIAHQKLRPVVMGQDETVPKVKTHFPSPLHQVAVDVDAHHLPRAERPHEGKR